MEKTLKTLNWERITGELHAKGYAMIDGLLPHRHCDEVVEWYDHPKLYRKTVAMERYRFGLGEYKYFDYPLPALIQQIREVVYPKLVPVANLWMDLLRIDKHFPDSFETLQNLCHSQQQHKPTPLILKYGKGGFNTLHQDLYGEVFFPFQLAIFLNQPEEDYSGGEFVLTEQIPRAQSRAIVLKPGKGDMLIFTTRFRAVRGKSGFYKANIRHGVSEVLEGTRYTLGIIFHDALS